MRLINPRQSAGIALIIVMIVIIALSALVGGFAYSMKVEMKLARNTGSNAELHWLGRSGVEFARYVLALQMSVPNEPYDSLNQKWAGGPGTSIGPEGTMINEMMAEISLTDNELGNGKFSVTITDLERKFNINVADPFILEQAFKLMGVDAALLPTVSDSIADWIDKDEDTHLSGAESDFYLSQQPSYFAKNGPLDDLSELLLIQGVTPAMYWGAAYHQHQNQGLLSKTPSQRANAEATYPVGFVDLFTTLSSRFININTASAQVLQLLPTADENVARAIVAQRAGPDGIDGTEDDVPFRSVGELVNVPGLSRETVLALQQRQLCFVRSMMFEVEVTAEMGGSKAIYYALLRRTGGNDIQLLAFYTR